MERNKAKYKPQAGTLLICKYLLICLVMISAFFMVSQRTEAKSAGWKKTYKKFLKKHSLDFNKISYIHLDNNKTPELITSGGKIFTIKKGKVKRIKGQAWVDDYWKKGNCFHSFDGDAEGCVTHTYYAIKSGKIVVKKVFDYESGRIGGTEGWKIDGKEVTESQFNTQFSLFKTSLTRKYGKPKKINYKDYKRYHFYNKQTRRYETSTDKAKLKIKGNYLYVKGEMTCGLGISGERGYIPGKIHVFKLTSKTRYIGGDVIISKKQMRKVMNVEGLWIIIDTKKGKVKDFYIVG